MDLSKLRSKRILVVGDLMLDHYTKGSASRISPEAPVPVLKVEETFHLPGGAGNAALNLKSLGADVFVMGRVGDDANGIILKSAFEKEGIDISCIGLERDYQTPVKNRLIADSQQLLRLDFETLTPLSIALEEALLEALPKVDAIAISDYGKGFLTPSILAKLIEADVPVIVDPKGTDFAKYSGATLLKPNLLEAQTASGCSDLNEAADKILRDTNLSMLLITRSRDGISLFNPTRTDFPARVREVNDVTGAGDTVLAMTTLGLANQMAMEEILPLANVAAGLAIEKLGCARISLSDLAKRLIALGQVKKTFTKETLPILKQALVGESLRTLEVDSRKGFTKELFTQIKSQPSQNQRLMITFTDPAPDPGLINLLESLEEIDFLLEDPSLLPICS